MSSDKNSQLTFPPAMWAQKYDTVYLTLNVECKEPVVTIDEDSVYFEGTCLPDNVHYKSKINLFAKIIPDKSSHINKGRNLELYLRKQEPTSWSRLMAENVKQHWLRVDFSKFDEDSGDERVNEESFEDLVHNLGGGNPDAKPNFDDAETDSDDDALPDLED